MFALLLVLLVPALAMYPSLFAFATDAKERLVATDYGPQALGQRERLKEQLQQTVDEIDAHAVAGGVHRRIADRRLAATDRTFLAFVVWSRTPLAVYRLTSAVELYRADGRLVSRFALNLPEYETTPYRPTGLHVGLARRILAVRIERAARAAREPRHLRRAAAGRSAASSCA